MRFFNTAGPVNPAKHYALDPLERLPLSEIELLIRQEKYFVLHAPRQTGKTSCLLALMAHLNRGNEFRSLYLNVEAAQTARGDVAAAMPAILTELTSRAQFHLADEFPGRITAETLVQSGPSAALGEVLTRWARHSDRPLVLLIDEIDSLVGDSLISVLRQLRAGYDKRPAAFPQSVVLCGVRDVRDYRMQQPGRQIITGGSAFNIKAASLRLGNFSKGEIEVLYYQHTEETGQEFLPEALSLAWELTEGQPWLVNALAYEACFEMKEGRDRSRPVTEVMISTAKENLILRRETHLDQLADKLKEERVRRVVELLLAGHDTAQRLSQDDVEYVRDLGLITLDGQIRVANRIYQEVIPRQLTYTTQITISREPAWFIEPDGRLNMEKLLAAFQDFFREHSEHWLHRYEYQEAGPQLLLQAFLQRIVNSGGRIEREYGLGRMRTDLLVIWPCGEGSVQKAVLELKVLHKGLDKTIADGLAQTWEYLDRCGANEGHLIIFNRTPGLSWEEKLFHRQESYQGRSIGVWGM